MPLENVQGTDHVLHAAIFEKTTKNNVKNSGETKFYNVMKKMVPSAGGTSLGTLTKSVAKNYSMNHTFNGSYVLPANANNPVNHSSEHTVEEFSDLGLLVWVQNTTTGEILQSAYATNSIGLQEFTADLTFSIYPNPADDEITIQVTENLDGTSIRVTNLQGQEVMTEEHNFQNRKSKRMNISTLPSGLYILQIQSESKSGTATFIVD